MPVPSGSKRPYSIRRARASTKKVRSRSLFFQPRFRGYHRASWQLRGRAGRPAGLLPLAALLAAAACGQIAQREIAQRILERYRKSASVKPLAAAQVIRLKLTGPNGSKGTAEISWQGADYRERRESAGLVTIRGLQGGKAYYTDEDGVTRVASEPVVRELTTRFYVWRRAFPVPGSRQGAARARTGRRRHRLRAIQPEVGQPARARLLAARRRPRRRPVAPVPARVRESDTVQGCVRPGCSGRDRDRVDRPADGSPGRRRGGRLAGPVPGRVCRVPARDDRRRPGLRGVCSRRSGARAPRRVGGRPRARVGRARSQDRPARSFRTSSGARLRGPAS